MNILVADDHALFRFGICQVLRRIEQTAQIVEAGSWPDAIHQAEGGSFDLILTDLMMPDGTPEEALTALRATQPKTPIVVVSMIEEAAMIRGVFRSGASGFIPKSVEPREFIEALRVVLSGGIYVPASAFAAIVTDAEASADEAHGPNPLSQRLTDRQKATLFEMARGKSNKEIARSLNITEATVKMHVAAIMRALKASNRTQAVIIAVREGLLPQSMLPLSISE
ncbi:MAG: response regulator transcription factor [Candidatus Competibacteraceae bacterium]|nr:response regulator transcription factor [Candidatus Competibacteraceae bacterium]